MATGDIIPQRIHTQFSQPCHFMWTRSYPIAQVASNPFTISAGCENEMDFQGENRSFVAQISNWKCQLIYNPPSAKLKWWKIHDSVSYYFIPVQVIVQIFALSLAIWFGPKCSLIKNEFLSKSNDKTNINTAEIRNGNLSDIIKVGIIYLSSKELHRQLTQ